MADIIDPVAAGVLGVPASVFGRNGQLPSAPIMRTLARGINHVFARHGTVMSPYSVTPGNAGTYASDTRVATAYYYAAPNHTKLMSRVMFIPTVDDDHSNPAWHLVLDGVAQTTQQHNRRCAAGAGLTLSDVFYRDQEITVVPGAFRRVDLYSENAYVIGWHLWESDVQQINAATDSGVSYADLVIGGGIYDATVADFQSALALAWKRCRGSYFCFNVPNPANGIAATTTYTNILDGSTTRTASTVGFRCSTAHRGSYLSDTVDVNAWALVERTGGSGTVTVRFAHETGNIDVECTGTLAICTKAGTLTEFDAGSKVDVQLHAPGGTDGKLYACGLIGYVA